MAEDSQQAKLSLSKVWQVPVALLGVVLLAAGWFLARPVPPPRDLAGELDQVRQLVAAREFEPALEHLDTMRPDIQQAPDKVRVEYHLALGDAICMGQRERDWDVASNHQNVITHYMAAEDLGYALDDRRRAWMIGSLLALGRIDEASQQVAAIGADSEPQRQRMRREVIAAVLEGDGEPDHKLKLLRKFLDEPNLERAHRIWAVARYAEVMMRVADPPEVSELLMRWLQRLDYPNREDLGELLVLLGRSELAAGARDEAERWFLQARSQIGEGDPLNGEAITGLGRIRFAEGNPADALELFEAVVKQYPSTRSYAEALVGKAECEARLNAYGDSLASYNEAVERVRSGQAPAGTQRRVHLSLESQRDWRYAKGDYELALRYALLEEKLLGERSPADLLRQLARTHEQIAREKLGLTEVDEMAADVSGHLRELDKDERLEVGLSFEKAAQYYYRHAQAVAAADDVSYGDSLWRAADCYDKAGLHRQAIEKFEEYTKTRPEDARRLDVTYRLAQAYQADGQFDAAIDLYRDLTENHPKSQRAYDALVPLARCYIAQGGERWGQAEQILRSVVTDHPALRPDSPQYREALTELGRLYYRRGESGDYERAIERLSEAVNRYGADQGAVTRAQILFQLGDAYRKSVSQIDRKLGEPLPPSRRTAFQQERAQRLGEAQQAFDSVIRSLEAADANDLNDLQKLYLRNSYFYRADCAYDLGRFEGPDGSIALYDLAAQRYEDDPAVLVAMIQIVNSYFELGKYDLARTANERAKWYLKRIPEDAFNDPHLPMSREHWQRWLDSTGELSLAAGTTPPAP